MQSESILKQLALRKKHAYSNLTTEIHICSKYMQAYMQVSQCFERASLYPSVLLMYKKCNSYLKKADVSIFGHAGFHSILQTQMDQYLISFCFLGGTGNLCYKFMWCLEGPFHFIHLSFPLAVLVQTTNLQSKPICNLDKLKN